MDQTNDKPPTTGDQPLTNDDQQPVNNLPPSWWQTSIIYHIYPRSFQDTTDTGVGDIQGIISRLDYLQDLGVGAIWLSPLYPSPNKDFGYDVSDYNAIHPDFGTMEDFTDLRDELHRRDMKIIMDMVLNHTSDQHSWFQEACSSRENPKRDWYIWKDGTAEGKPPNNWKSVFGGSSWEWHSDTEQYYLHSFLKEQPDLNWRNPKVREALWEVIRFWLDLGVDGFRFDVINCFIKDIHFRDNPRRSFGLRAYDRQRHIYDRDRAGNYEYIRQIRALVNQYTDRMTIGEVMVDGKGSPQLAADYYDEGQGLHMAFNFAFTSCPWRAEAFAEAVDQWEAALGEENWPNYVLSNHDRSRAISRYGSGLDSIPRAKVAAAMLLTLRGTPFIYYGEEIGMADTHISRRRLQDPVGKRYWPLHPGRDPVRTPMQWDNTLNAGFSHVVPWLPVNKNYLQTNVLAQLKDPLSLLSWYRTLIRLRKSEPALLSGSYTKVTASGGIFSYERALDDSHIFVALNFLGKEKQIDLPAPGPWMPLLRENLAAGSVLSTTDTLPPYGVLIARDMASD
ncbi:MAG: alpha-glucosidase [Candidatus Promineifilaceae bacterium]